MCLYAQRRLLALVVVLLACASSPTVCTDQSSIPMLGVDKSRLELGEAQLRELENKAEHSPCWREAVSRLDISCKQLSDIQQSRLAVAFANCHLNKSGRQTYPCNDEMTIRECTEDMDHNAYQTYTHFFTHTGHICYFLQIELWQGRTEGLIGRLSHTSSQAVEKLEQSLEYHHVMDRKQDTALRNQDTIIEQDRKIASSLAETHKVMEASFSEMSVMAEQQKALLGEMFGSLQTSVETVRGLMSLLVVEFIGWETVAVFVISWLVVMLLPQYRYSRLKMMLALVAEVAVEVCVRRIYGYVVLGGDSLPQDLSGLHSMLWTSRYVCGAVSLTLYLWEWYHYLDYGERNYRLLTEIKEMMKGRTGGIVRSSAHPSGPTDELIMEGAPQTRAPIPLPDVPHRTAQPVVHGYISHDSPDTPDSTESLHEPQHTSRYSTYYAGTLVSSDEEATDVVPDNDRAACRIKKASRPARVQKSSKYPSRSGSVPQSRPSPSLRVASYISSDEEEGHQSPTSHTHSTQGKVSLTRSPIHTQDTPQSRTTATTSKSSGRRIRSKTAGGDGVSYDNRLHPSDPEPEKEVMEEKDTSGLSGSRRGLRPSDHLTGQQVPATPTMTSSTPSRPPASGRRGHQSRSTQSHSATPLRGGEHRYNLRSRTPLPK